MLPNRRACRAELLPHSHSSAASGSSARNSHRRSVGSGHRSARKRATIPSCTSRPNRKVLPPGVNAKCPTTARFDSSASAIPATAAAVGTPSCGRQAPIKAPTSLKTKNITSRAATSATIDMWVAIASMTIAASRRVSHLRSRSPANARRCKHNTDSGTKVSGINCPANHGRLVSAAKTTTTRKNVAARR